MVSNEGRSSEGRKPSNKSIIDGNPKRKDPFWEPYTVDNYKEGHRPLTPDHKIRSKYMTMLKPEALNNDIITYGDRGDKYRPVEVTGRNPNLQVFKPNNLKTPKNLKTLKKQIHEFYPEYTLPVKISSRRATPGAELSKRNPSINKRTQYRSNKRSNDMSKKGGRKTRKARK